MQSTEQLTPAMKLWLAALPPTITTSEIVVLFRQAFNLTPEAAQELLGCWVRVKWDEFPGKVAA